MAFENAAYIIPVSPTPLPADPTGAPEVVSVSIGGGFLPLLGGSITGRLFTQDIVPDIANTYDLGNVSLYWKQALIDILFVDDIESRSATDHVLFTDDIDPKAGALYDLGDNTTYWQEISGTLLSIDTLQSRNAQTFIDFIDDLTPSISNNQDLGATSKYWTLGAMGTLFVDQLDSRATQVFIDVNDDLVGTTGGAKDLGNVSKYWQLGIIDAITVDNLESRTATDHVLFTDDVDPVAGALYDLGDGGLYWQDVVTNTITANIISPRSSNVAVDSDFLPKVNDSYELGLSSRYWTSGYIDNLFVDKITARGGANVQVLDDLHITQGHLALAEISTPTGLANGAVLYAVVTGGGKTDLRVIFQTGASILIATEP